MENYKIIVHIKNKTQKPIHNKLECRVQINDQIKSFKYPFTQNVEFFINHLSQTSIVKLNFDYQHNQIGILYFFNIYIYNNMKIYFLLYTGKMNLTLP